MWCLQTQFSGGLGSDILMVGLYDLESFFQLKQLYSSVILTSSVWQGQFNMKKKKEKKFKKSNLFLLLSMFRIFGNFTTIIDKFHSWSPLLPDKLTLLQTSDTVDSAHI